MGAVARQGATGPRERLTLERTGAADGEPRWVATVEGVPGCRGEGETPAAAVAAADAAADAFGSERAHSGRLLLRMPRSLHAELAARADDDRLSLNQLIVASLADMVAAPGRATTSRLPRRIRLALAANAAVVVLALAVVVLILAGAWQP